MQSIIRFTTIILGLIFTSITYASHGILKTIEIRSTVASGEGKLVGTIEVEDTKYGLKLSPKLDGLPPGVHGFHVHENSACGDNGKAAGGHYDPRKTGHHFGPYNKDGHLGDLPALVVNQEGKARIPTIAPRLKERDLKGRALIIHGSGDNYSDEPPLGGGGARLYCGVIIDK